MSHKNVGLFVVAVTGCLLAGLLAPVAAQSSPVFQMPVRCGEIWGVQTYEGHGTTPEDYPVDLFYEANRAEGRGRLVLASAAGRVTRTSDNASTGKHVIIDHGGGWSTLYNHLETVLVSQGAQVSQGTQIGTNGDTGTGQGAYHIHYEQRLDGAEQHVTFNGKRVNYYEMDHKPTSYISWNSCPGGVLPANEPAPTCEPGSAPTADYRFADSLASIVAGAPALQPLAATTFATDTVEGRSRRVFSFTGNNGFKLGPIDGVIGSRHYTIVALVRLDDPGRAGKLVDWREGLSDQGLYVASNKLVLHPHELWWQPPTAPTSFVRGAYAQIAITRDETTDVTKFYVNGVLQFGLDFWSDIAVVSPADTLHFFRDDDDTINSPVENATTAGSIARLRLFGRPLTASEVQALDRLPADDSQAPSGTTCGPPQPRPTQSAPPPPPPPPPPDPSASPTPEPQATEPALLSTTTEVSMRSTRRQIKVAGAVSPSGVGGTVRITLARSTGGPFRGVASATVSGAGAFETSFARPRRGTCRVIAQFSGDSERAPSRGKVKRPC
ncbi:MAG TPA: peptidoglycan DD-metalloendopeptidase family protein [Actinomycetota bacterium]|nr:peptidoglycan DD-metalloendopeptidase family protein [Actinomycetota bacterium]